LPAGSAIFEIVLQIHAHIAAGRAIRTGEVARAVQTNRDAVRWRRAGRAAAAAVQRVRSEPPADPVAAHAAWLASGRSADDWHTEHRACVALVTAAAFELGVARLAVQILGQLVGTGPVERGKPE